VWTETSYRKGHDYVTVVTDQQQGAVLHVAETRETDSLSEFYRALSEAQKDGIKSVCMDMLPAYIKASRDALTNADRKIAFDRFHVAQYLGKAVDQVRRQEHRHLIQQGDERMKGSKYYWLRNRGNMDWHQQRSFSALRQSSLKTARAWAIKELASRLWEYRSWAWAHKGWKRLINWMAHSRLKPMQQTAKTLRKQPVGHSQRGATGCEQQPC